MHSSSSFTKVFLGILGSLVLIGVVLVMIAPALLSTEWGKGILLREIGKKFSGKVEVEKLSLSFWGTQRIEGIQVHDQQGDLVLVCPSLFSDQALWNILFFRDIGKTLVSKPHFYVRKNLVTMKTRLQRNLAPAGFLAEMDWNWKGFRDRFFGTLQVEGGAIDVLSLGAQPICFEQLDLVVSIPEQEDPISFTLQGITRQGQQTGTIGISGQVIPSRGALPQVSLNATCERFPIAGIDQILAQFNPSWNGLLAEAVGDTLNLDLKIDGIQEAFTLNGKVSSPFLNGSIQARTEGDHLNLLEPAEFRFSATPGWAKRLPFAGLQIGDPIPFNLTITSLSYPLNGNWEDLKGVASVSATAPFRLIGNNQPVQVDQLTGQLQASEGKISLQADLFSSLSQMKLQGKITDLVRSPTVQGTLVIDQLSLAGLETVIGMKDRFTVYLGDQAGVQLSFSSQGEKKEIELTAKTPLLQFGPAQLALGREIQIVQPAPFTYLLSQWGKTPLQGNVAGSFSLLAQGGMKGKGKIEIPQLVYQSLTLSQGSFPFQFNTAEEKSSLQADCLISDGNQPAGSLKLAAQQSGIQLEAKAEGNQLSTRLLEMVSQTALIPWIGNTVQFQLQFAQKGERQTVSLKGASSEASVNIALAADDKGIRLQGNGGELSWSLTPERFQELDRLLSGQNKGQPPFSLSQSATFSCTLTHLLLPTTGKAWNFNYAALQVNLSGQAGDVSVFDRTSQEKIHLSAVRFALNRKEASVPLEISAAAQVSTQSTLAAQPGNKTGSLQLKGSIGNTSQLDLQISQFPSRILDLLARTQGATSFPFTAFFGENISASLKTSLNGKTGPVQLNVNSDRSRLSVMGKLVDGALTLDQPLHAQTALTPELSRLILKEANPLAISYFYARAPLTLTLSAKDFYLPLFPFQLNRAQISSGRLELGKVYCHNEGNLNAALGLLKSKQFDQSKELVLWFAPADFSLAQGRLDLERTEILVSDTYDIAIWGKVDLLKDYVDMVLGLTAPTLRKAFGIRDLPEDYVLTIPMKGPSNQVQIDKGKATSKIALLIAWQQKGAAAEAAGGPAGALLGGFLNKVVPVPGGNGKVPPAKHPFPWEMSRRGKESSLAEPSPGKKKHFKSKERPIKQILKVIR